MFRQPFNSKAANQKTIRRAEMKSIGKITELIFILDRSGSMANLTSETIDGYNSMIKDQRKIPGTCRVTTVLFNNEVETIIDHLDLDTVAPMTRKEYRACGCTALLDAIGLTIKSVNKTQKTNEEGRPDHTVVIVATDGMENASHAYDLEKVRSMIEKRQKKNDWKFIFLGANMDAVSTASEIGIEAECAITYKSDSAGTMAMYEAAGCAASLTRQEAPIGTSWKRPIEEDLASRK